MSGETNNVRAVSLNLDSTALLLSLILRLLRRKFGGESRSKLRFRLFYFNASVGSRDRFFDTWFPLAFGSFLWTVLPHGLCYRGLVWRWAGHSCYAKS